MPTVNVPSVKLNDGNQFPLMGFGTSRALGNNPHEAGYEAVKNAIKSGYRLIDTAALYLNEEAVGNAIRDCVKENIVKREEMFVCTKVWNTAHKRESVMRACKESLKRLNLDYVDMYLVHWPLAYQEGGDPINPRDPETGKVLYSDTHYTETWLGMEDVKDAGLAKSIGVSNFNHLMLEDIYAMPCKHKPTVNQVECHPYLNQQKLLEFSRKNDIVLMAYCPLGSPKMCAQPDQPTLLDDPVVNELAHKYKKSPAQILNRFLIDRGICTIPKSVTPTRIEENINIFDFELSESDLNKLLTLDRNLRYCLNIGGAFIDDHPLYPFKVEY